MKINDIKVFVPITVEVELKNGNQNEIFAMFHMPSKTILIPDDKDIALLADDIDEFKSLVCDKLLQPVEQTEIRLPNDKFNALGHVIEGYRDTYKRAMKKVRS